MDQQVKHVVTLSADLKPSLNPIQLGCLEEFRSLQLPEKIFLRHGFLGSRVKLVKDKAFEQFLVGYANFNGLTRRAVLQNYQFLTSGISCALLIRPERRP